MSLVLWNRLPRGLLKKQFKAWDRLGPDVKRLVVKLAEEQKFKCVHCSRERNLIIEHDHDPVFGPGDKLTAFNIRGLVCQKCNWHLMIYEKDLNGEYRGFDDVYSYISDSDWESYIYAYDNRIIRLYENQLEERMGPLNYWRRRLVLDKFDDWKEWGGRKKTYPWHWGFDEIKERQRNIIRTPEQFIQALAAMVEYMKSELVKDPDWRPPIEVMPILKRVVEFLNEALGPDIEQRLLAIKAGQITPPNVELKT